MLFLIILTLNLTDATLFLTVSLYLKVQPRLMENVLLVMFLRHIIIIFCDIAYLYERYCTVSEIKGRHFVFPKGLAIHLAMLNVHLAATLFLFLTVTCFIFYSLWQ